MQISKTTTTILNRLHAGAHIDPVRDWLVLCLFSVAMLIGIIVWNLWTFGTVIGGGTIGAPPPSAPAAFNLSSLNTIRTMFADRALEEMKYETGIYSVADPSQ